MSCHYSFEDHSFVFVDLYRMTVKKKIDIKL